MFVVGELYRRRDLHREYGGQKQGGISTPARHQMIFIFSGESGRQYGYYDGYQPDGSYWYSGEGQRGDMPWVRGNAAIRDHAKTGKAIHVFSDAGGGWVRYEGEATYIGHHIEQAPDLDRQLRNAIVFELAMDSSGPGTPFRRTPERESREPGTLWKMDLSRLRQLATARPKEGTPAKKRRVVARKRSQAVRVYVLRRAGGICEGCSQAAPFARPGGQPYLEPHHIRRVADEGPDEPRWVVALCPNCHRHVHYGRDGEEYNRTLGQKAGELERGQ